MKDVTNIVEIIEKRVAELRHADALITDQAERILTLEAEIALLRNVLGPAAA
jgi:hypothetical protein